MSLINFAVDTASPSVLISSVENKTYTTSDVPLNFTVSEIVSQISYVLDGQKNVTINGNTTLTGLSCGAHNLTVYAWDTAGNVGVSETVYFTVEAPEPFPVTVVAAASTVVAAVICISLVIYLTKMRRKQKPETPHQ